MTFLGTTLTLTCPEHGTLSLRCAHPELADRQLGLVLMLVGLALAIAGLMEVLA